METATSVGTGTVLRYFGEGWRILTAVALWKPDFEAVDGVHSRRCIAASAASEREDFDGLGLIDRPPAMSDKPRRVNSPGDFRPYESIGTRIVPLDDIASEGFDVLADHKDRDIKILVAP